MLELCGIYSLAPTAFVKDDAEASAMGVLLTAVVANLLVNDSHEI